MGFGEQMRNRKTGHIRWQPFLARFVARHIVRIVLNFQTIFKRRRTIVFHFQIQYLTVLEPQISGNCDIGQWMFDDDFAMKVSVHFFGIRSNGRMIETNKRLSRFRQHIAARRDSRCLHRIYSRGSDRFENSLIWCKLLRGNLTF